MNQFLKWLKRALIIFGVLVLIILILVGLKVFGIWYENTYKSHIQTLEIPDRKIKFVLLTDIAGFGDRSWYVYLLPIESSFTKRMNIAHDTDGVLFWNYSEAGDHYDDPKMELVKEHFLVFSRGGAYHSLYDIKNEQVVLNDESPREKTRKCSFTSSIFGSS